MALPLKHTVGPKSISAPKCPGPATAATLPHQKTWWSERAGSLAVVFVLLKTNQNRAGCSRAVPDLGATPPAPKKIARPASKCSQQGGARGGGCPRSAGPSTPTAGDWRLAQRHVVPRWASRAANRAARHSRTPRGGRCWCGPGALDLRPVTRVVRIHWSDVLLSVARSPGGVAMAPPPPTATQRQLRSLTTTTTTPTTSTSVAVATDTSAASCEPRVRNSKLARPRFTPP